MDDTGPRIPGFTITGYLGRGGCGTVYAAMQDRLGRKVALKVLSPEALASKQVRRRFQREAQALAAVRHPGVVEVLAFQGDGPVPFIAMEMLAKGTLRDRVDKAPRGVGTEASLRLARELLEALDALHGAGMIHRDVKPSNVLFRDDGQAVLSDLGVVRVNAEGATRMTGTGELLGTLAYFAPELYRDREPTVRSDLFALGVTLHEAITGQHPTEFRPFPKDFEGTDPRKLAPGCAPGLASLVVRMLSGDPARRPASAAAALEKLEGTAADRSDRVRPRSVLGRPTYPVAGIALAAGLALGLAGGVWLGARQAPVALVPAVPAAPATLLGLATWPQPALALEAHAPLRASWLDAQGQPTDVRDVPLLPGRATVPVPVALVPARRGVLRLAPLEGRADELTVDLTPLAPPLPDPQLGIAIPVGATEPVLKSPRGTLRLVDLVRQMGATRVACLAPRPTPALAAALGELAQLPDVRTIVQIPPEDDVTPAAPPGQGPWARLIREVPGVVPPQVMVLPALPTQDPFASSTPIRPSLPPALEAAWRRDLRALSPELNLLPPPIALAVAAIGVDVATPADRPLSVVAPAMHDSLGQWDAMVAKLTSLLGRPDAAARVAYVWLSQRESTKDAWNTLAADAWKELPVKTVEKAMVEELSLARTLVLARRAFPQSTLICELAYEVAGDGLTAGFDVVVRTAGALRGLTCTGSLATSGDHRPRVAPAPKLVALRFGGARNVQVIFADAGRCTTRFTPAGPGMLLVSSNTASRNIQRVHLDSSPIDLDMDGGLALYEELAPAAATRREH